MTTTKPKTLPLELDEEDGIILDSALRADRRHIREQIRIMKVRALTEPDLDPTYVDWMLKNLTRQEAVIETLLTSVNRIIDRLI